LLRFENDGMTKPIRSEGIELNEGRAALRAVLASIELDQANGRRSLNLTPSENAMSPMARLPFAFDAASRYFFDHLRKFGAWCFYGALGAGTIEYDLLVPLLRELTDAPFVNTQPISGLTCMMVAMGALAEPGQTILTVPVDGGGHISTTGVARRLGLQPSFLPMHNAHDIDLDGLARILETDRPAAIYVDQSNVLFPFDLRPVRALIDRYSPATLLHYDSSHLNGLILGGALPNPLRQGADSFGGSTHKTLPGPHKGFLVCRRPELARRIDETSGLLISQHQPAAVASLAITLLELRHRGGSEYARLVTSNAVAFARTLHRRGVSVAAAERGFTGCHQVWVDSRASDGAIEVSERFFDAGIVVNRVSVPGIEGRALRLSVAEVTRLGARERETEELADLIADAIVEGRSADSLRPAVAGLRERLCRPRYCFEQSDLDPLVRPEIRDLLAALEHVVGSPTPAVP